MFLIKGYLIKRFESVIVDAINEEQAIKIYNRKFERGEIDSDVEDFDLEIMKINDELENVKGE